MNKSPNFLCIFFVFCFLLIPCMLLCGEIRENKAGIDKAWLGKAIEQIKKDEYKPTIQNSDYKGETFDNSKLHFANRANNLRVYIDENGIELMPRVTKGENDWSIKIKSISLILDEEEKLLKLSPEIKGDSIISATDMLDLNISNSQDGLIINISIKEEIDAIKLNLENKLCVTEEENKFIFEDKVSFGIDGKSSYTLSSDENNLEILLKNEETDIPGILEIKITSLNQSVETVTLLPSSNTRGLSETADWTAEFFQGSNHYRFSVSSAGDVNGDGYSDVIVGTPFYDNGETNEGGAFVFHGSSSGLSTSADWTAESDQEDAYFGWSVSSAGDVNGDGYSDVIVGAYVYNNGESNEGVAFVYHGSSSGLSTSANWTAESNQEDACLGVSVSSAGDVNGDGYSDVIVGAYNYNNGESGEGVAFVYHGSSSGLSTSYDWIGEADQVDASFGVYVSSAGDVNGDGYSDVIIGAHFYDNGESNEGVAFVYHGSSSGLSGSYDWIGEADQANARLGISVSSAGDVNGDGYSDVIVGAYFYDNGQTEEGAAFVYQGSSSGLSTSADWTVESNQDNAFLGWSVSSAGDVNGDGYSDVIVGADHYDNGEEDEGVAFVYHGSSSGLSGSYDWIGEVNQVDAQFGIFVSTAGDVNGDGYSDVIVGAWYYDGENLNQDAAFVYHGNPSGLDTTESWTAEPDQAYANFGRSVSSAGDVNGDGYSDVIVGAYYYDNGQIEEGCAFVYHGGSSGLSSSPDWTAESDQDSAFFGYSVSSAGDVNGDGYSDVIVGAYGYDSGEKNDGTVFVYHGSSSGLSSTPTWTAESDQDSAYLGYSVSSAGDVNGDGYSDVIVGARNYDNDEIDEGAAFVYHGSSSGLSSTPTWSAESDQEFAGFGYSVSSAGDVNGDGYSDVIVGATYYDNEPWSEGRAFVYHGSASGLNSTENWTAEAYQDIAWFGFSVSSAGDVNGDGYSDVIVGAIFFDNGQQNEGRAFVYHGSASGLSSSPDWTAESNQENALFGTSVSSAGDVNGDGYSDVIVGAYFYDNGQTEEGAAFVYHGSASGLSSSPAWTEESNQENALFGCSASSAGDVNGDGYSDVIVGAWYYENGQTKEGRAFVYYGNSSNGLSITPAQFASGDNHPVQLGNAIGSSGAQLRVSGRTPGGRGKIKLQWEVKKLGDLFDGSSLSESASWYDTYTTGIDISEDITGLSDGTAYHWRARFKYDPLTYDGSLYSRWFSIGPNGWNETDFITSIITGIEEYENPKGNVRLNVFPTASTKTFSISFGISADEAEENIKLGVFNKAGIKVANIFTGKREPGNYTINWCGTDSRSQLLPNDIYFISLKIGNKKHFVKKVILLR